MRIAEGITWSSGNGKIQIIRQSDDLCLFLDRSSAIFWNLFSSGQEFDEIVNSLSMAFPISRNTIEYEMSQVVENLLDKGIIERKID